MSNKTDLAHIVSVVAASGWKSRRCRHGQFVYPTDKTIPPITIPGTPSDYRSIRNCRAQLRRAGLSV